MEKLCGFVAPAGDKAYFFTGDRYLRYDVESDGADDGYPLEIAAHWPGLFAADIDAALPFDDGTIAFFRGAECAVYDLAADAVVDGPRPIEEVWPGVFPFGIDAVLADGEGGIVFFRTGSYQVWRDGSVDPEPRSVADDWPGLPVGLETALWWPSGNAYAFAGAEYVRYDVASRTVAEDFPRPLADWRGLPVGPLAAPAPVAHRGVREVFPGFSEPLEGRVRYLYQDVLGLVTVGVGNLVDRPEDAAALPFHHVDAAGVATGVPASHEEIVAEWHLIKSAPGLARAGHLAAKRIRTLELSDAAVDDLVRARFDINETRLARFFPGWAGWPADARLGAHSIAWAGAFFPTRWPAFTAAANAGNWLTAAAESRLQETGNPGVAHRNRANRVLFTNAAAVLARGLDPTVVHYPTEL